MRETLFGFRFNSKPETRDAKLQKPCFTSTLGLTIARLPAKFREDAGQVGRLRPESARVDPAREALLASRKARWESHPPTRNSSVWQRRSPSDHGPSRPNSFSGVWKTRGGCRE